MSPPAAATATDAAQAALARRGLGLFRKHRRWHAAPGVRSLSARVVGPRRSGSVRRMIVIIAELTLSEAARARMLPVLRTLDRETQREAGCLFFRNAIDVSQPDTVVLTEVWQDG